jgi:hypothetical protein
MDKVGYGTGDLNSYMQNLRGKVQGRGNALGNLAQRTGRAQQASVDFLRAAEGVSKRQPKTDRQQEEKELDKKIVGKFKQYSETTNLIEDVEKDLDNCQCCVIS